MTIHRDKLVAAIKPVVDRVYADRTEGQRAAITAAVADLDSFELCRRDGIAFPQAFEVELLANGVVQCNARLTRDVPNPEQIAEALAKSYASKLGSCPPDKRITFYRLAQKATPDERLAMIGDLPVEPPVATKAEPTPVAPVSLATASDDALDAEAARRAGHASVDVYRASVFASRVLENRRQLRRQNALPSSPALTQAKAQGQSLEPGSADFQTLPPARRIALFRAQQKAVGNR